MYYVRDTRGKKSSKPTHEKMSWSEEGSQMGVLWTLMRKNELQGFSFRFCSFIYFLFLFVLHKTGVTSHNK